MNPMGIVEWCPLLIAAVSACGATASYAYEKHIDRRTALIASDDVILACSDFTAFYRPAPNAEPDARAEKYSKLEMAMRRDCFEKTKITAGQLRQMLPFTF